uniref:Uncharacterized protein C03B8.2 n=1 Tax=Caenorhabditis elegans TaxID=6239 RepID=YPB2_CAEEL|nr:RecName: Full=Uncharacterized protein C03B8.2 [Caenorhabditis elegans]|eukprot:NP_498680.1 Uncharacterized protein CELE_C03B8.2 [Caenorhabditis elegans]
MRNAVKLLELSLIDDHFLRYRPSDAAQNHRINNSTKFIFSFFMFNKQNFWQLFSFCINI